MNAVIFHGHSVFNYPPCFSFSKQIRLGEPICSLKDGPLAFALPKDPLQFSVSSTKSDGSRKGRPSRKSYAPGRTKKEDEGEKSQSSDGKLPSAEKVKIMALFRRIQSSISKGEAKSTKQTKDDLSGESPNESGEAKSTKQTKDDLSGESPNESVLKVLRDSEKPVKDAPPKSRGGNQVLAQKQGVPKKDRNIQNGVQQPAAKIKVTRLPSMFVKKSPIPSPSTPRGKKIEENNDLPGTTDSGKRLTMPRIEEMKLPELKELAKSRGIKGYSKLKKSELLELLR